MAALTAAPTSTAKADTPIHSRTATGAAERAVDRRALDGVGEVDPQQEAAEHPHAERHERAGDVLDPGRAHRHGHVVERGEEGDGQQDHDGPVQDLYDGRAPTARTRTTRVRADHHQRQRDRADQQGHDVQQEGSSRVLTMPRRPSRPYMTVMVSMKTFTAREPDHRAISEADGDDVGAAALDDVVQERLGDLR